MPCERISDDPQPPRILTQFRWLRGRFRAVRNQRIQPGTKENAANSPWNERRATCVGEAGRSNPATLLLINDVPYLVDCGYGATKQLLLAGIAVNRVRYIFI